MSIHYKFKSALDFDTVTFDGLHISVGDLKKAIIHQKRLGKVTDFDLQITNAQTKEEYEDDSCLIPKNTSLVIARIPLTHQPKKTWSSQPDNPLQVRSVSKAESTSLDLSKMKGTEEEKIQAMMLQSTADYDPKSYHRIRGQSQTGEVPATYRCNKCKKGGHWIKNCTVVIGKEHMDIKRNTGIPKSFRDKDDKAVEAEKPDPTSTGEKTQEIPEDLLCSICNDLFVDAVMIPCCGSSFCDDCVRTALLESEDNECPDCKEKGSSPGSLIPNRFLRNSVNAFRNETGYNATHLQKVLHGNKPNESLEDKPEIVSFNVPEMVSKPCSKAVEEDIARPTNLSEESSIELESNKNTQRKVETPSCEDIDSDFEDNITVMMPPAKIKSPHAVFRERPYNGRSSRHPKPPGIESSPRNHLQVSPLRSYHDNKHRSPLETNNIEWERECERERDYHEQSANLKPICQSSNLVPHYSLCKSQARPVRPMNSHDVFSGPPNRINTYQQVPTHPQIIQVPSVQGPAMGSFDNIYNQIGPRTNLGYSHCIRPMFHNTSSGYMTMRGPLTDQIQPLHTNNLASVYQGVAAKVGTGIIDDPLEAFNRLMKEKEKRKEERRRSQEHRRSRSIERQQTSRFRSSPYDRKTEKKDKEKPLRMRDQRPKHGFENRHEKDKSFSHRYSQSFSDRSSRSRSWSNSPHKKCSKSPVHNRRSRSRTHAIGEKKRHMEKRYSLRREDDFRYQSPIPNLRRSRSRERPHPQYQTNWYSQHVSSTHTTNKFKRENIRSPYKRSLTPQLKREQQNSGVNIKRIEDSQLEILEPPPPGFEGNPSQDCNNWNILQQDTTKLLRKRTPPDLYEKCVSQDVEEKNIYGPHSYFNRSNAKFANQTSDKNKRHGRSRTPTSKPPATNAFKPKETINRRPRKSPERRKREKNVDDIERDAKHSKEQKRDRSKEQENIGEAVNDSEVSKQEEESMKYVISEKCENQFSGKGIDRTLKNIGLNKEKTKKPCLINEEKTDKKLKYRKKKKEKSERKKLKKDKKEKRERDKERNTSEQQQNDETETIKTPDLNTNMTAMEEHLKLQIEERFENVPAAKWNPETKHVCKDPIEDGELIDGSNNETNNVVHQPPTKTKNDATIESEIKRVDSILDIHGYETDFDETNSLDPRNKTILIAPEPSKWERDEQISISVPVTNHYHENIGFPEENREKVTNEVLRKAENAIFARAINAIRPIEVKNTNTEYQEIRPTSPQMSAIFQNNSKENMKSFKITVPLSNSQERSVEIKGDGKNKSRSPKVTKSVKDRLGSKIVNKREFSRHNDMQNNRSANRSRSRDRHPSLNKTSEMHKERLDDHRARYRDRARNRDREGFNKRFEEYKSSRSSLNSIVDRRQGDDGARKLNSDHLSHRSIKSSKSYKPENNNDRAGSRHDEKSSVHRKNEETLRSELKQKKPKEHNKSENTPAVSNLKNEGNVKNPFSKNENTDSLRCLDKNYEIKKQSNITDAESYTDSMNTDSDSEDHKRHKRHKYKKDKKRIKRSSSTESGASAKKKHIKSKKRNKSAKKKKKNKK